jgi:hypothetical protein
MAYCTDEPRNNSTTDLQFKMGNTESVTNSSPLDADRSGFISAPCPDWLLCSMMVLTAHGYGSDERYEVLHIEAPIPKEYLELQGDITWKLSTATTKLLIDHHKSFCSIYRGGDADSDFAQQALSLHREFVSKVDRFTYVTPVDVLKENMDDDGTGEFPCGPREEVHNMIMQLYQPLACFVIIVVVKIIELIAVAIQVICTRRYGEFWKVSVTYIEEPLDRT